MIDSTSNRMSERPKRHIEKKDDIHPDLARLAKSMRTLLARKYPNVVERQVVAEKIMRQVQDFACV